MQGSTESPPTSVTNLSILDRAECAVSRSDKGYPWRRMIRFMDFLYFPIVWELMSVLYHSYHQSTNYIFKGQKALSESVVWFTFLKQTFLLFFDCLSSSDFSLSRPHFKVHLIIKWNEKNVLQRFSGLVGFMQPAATQWHLVISYHYHLIALQKKSTLCKQAE